MTDAPLCGLPHYTWPETMCTEPAGHYRPNTDPHAGPLTIDGRHRGGCAWDEPADQPPYDTAIDTAQQAAEQHTDDALRQRLTRVLDDCRALTPDGQADAVLAALAPELAELADYRNRINWQTTCGNCAQLLDASYAETVRAEQAEAALAQEKQRQEHYEEEIIGRFNKQATDLARRAGTAEARIARVRALHQRSDARRPLDLSLTPITHCASCGQDWPCDTNRALDTPEPTP